MPELKNAIIIVELIVLTAITLLIGDFVGYRIGQRKLAAIIGTVVLISVIAFAIYAAIVLA